MPSIWQFTPNCSDFLIGYLVPGSNAAPSWQGTIYYGTSWHLRVLPRFCERALNSLTSAPLKSWHVSSSSSSLRSSPSPLLSPCPPLRLSPRPPAPLPRQPCLVAPRRSRQRRLSRRPLRRRPHQRRHQPSRRRHLQVIASGSIHPCMCLCTWCVIVCHRSPSVLFTRPLACT